MNLSPNLTLAEVVKSNTAIRLNIDNSNMSEDVLNNLKALAEHVFQPTRDQLGPIRISSGYRSPALNSAIGGAQNSQHSKGEALDLQGIRCSNKAIFQFIKNNLVFDQLIWEFGNDNNPHWVHVSYKRDNSNRKSILKSIKTNGRTSYEKWIEKSIKL